MFELLSILVAILALLAVACMAFVRSEGAVWRSALAGALAALGAGVMWRMAVLEGASAALSQWLAAFLVGLAAAVLSLIAALTRNLLNALGARILR